MAWRAFLPTLSRFSLRQWLVRWPAGVVLKATMLTAGCALLAGCLMVPVRTPKAVKGPDGSIKKLDLKFLAAGSSSRAEVLNKLGVVNAAPGFDRFLWARWKQSAWAVAWMVGSYAGGYAGANRMWGSENLLVLFDREGKVKEYRRISDGKLAKELRAVLKDEPPLPREPAFLSAEHRHHHTGFSGVEITLKPDVVQFREPGNSTHSFDVLPSAIASLDSALHDVDVANVMDVEETIHFRNKTAVGDKISLRMHTEDFVILLRYINQYCPQVR